MTFLLVYTCCGLLTGFAASRELYRWPSELHLWREKLLFVAVVSLLWWLVALVLLYWIYRFFAERRRG